MYDSDLDSDMEDLPPLIDLNPSSMVAESSPGREESRFKTESTQMHESSSAKNEKAKNDNKNTGATTNHVDDEQGPYMGYPRFTASKPRPIGFKLETIWAMESFPCAIRRRGERKRMRDEE